MFTRRWELKQFFSSLQVPNPKPTEEYGIFCVDFTTLWTTAHWRELGSLPTDTSREKSLLHPQGNGALQCDCLPKWTMLSSYFSLPSYHITEDLYLRTLRATHPMLPRDGRVCAEKKMESLFNLESTLLQRNNSGQHLKLLSHSIGWHKECKATVSACHCPFLSHRLSKDWTQTFLGAMD